MAASRAPITAWASKSGEFNRMQSQFRHAISNQPGAEFPAQKGRYRLYVSYACPWAHRALIVRKLKGLEEILPYTIVHWEMLEKGWRFYTAEEKEAQSGILASLKSSQSQPSTDEKNKDVEREKTKLAVMEEEVQHLSPDPSHQHHTHLRHLYLEEDPQYDGRFTVPLLYDIQQKKIVSNESSEIIRMLYTEFDHLLPKRDADVKLLPDYLRSAIEETNEWTYNDINNGVYKSGFATTQDAYEKAVVPLFTALDRAENHLAQHAKPFYYGNTITEADVRLYTTICRFDAVYVQHFKCNIRDIRSGYPHLHTWLQNLYWTVPAFKETTNFEHIKNHYTKSHKQINPTSVTPIGPNPDILPLHAKVAAAAAATQSRS